MLLISDLFVWVQFAMVVSAFVFVVKGKTTIIAARRSRLFDRFAYTSPYLRIIALRRLITHETRNKSNDLIRN